MLNPLIVLWATAASVHGHGGSDSSSMGMVPWLHFELGDALFFQQWAPATPGAVFGACFGLFLMAVMERLLSAMRAVMERWWIDRVREALAKEASARGVGNDERTAVNDSNNSTPPPNPSEPHRSYPPFISAHDLTRGLLQVGQSALGFALMLAVMTFHAGYFISIVVGLGFGEVLFGRFSRGAGVH